MRPRLDFERDGKDWPNRQASRFVKAAGLTWHVQIMGQGPVVLLVHGTGASTHSYGKLAQILAKSFTVVVPDLPGHGFTDLPPTRRLSLPCMAADLRQLLNALGVKPVLSVGHSAGAAILVQMCLDGASGPMRSSASTARCCRSAASPDSSSRRSPSCSRSIPSCRASSPGAPPIRTPWRG